MEASKSQLKADKTHFLAIFIIPLVATRQHYGIHYTDFFSFLQKDSECMCMYVRTYICMYVTITYIPHSAKWWQEKSLAKQTSFTNILPNQFLRLNV